MIKSAYAYCHDFHHRTLFYLRQIYQFKCELVRVKSLDCKANGHYMFVMCASGSRCDTLIDRVFLFRAICMVWRRKCPINNNLISVEIRCSDYMVYAILFVKLFAVNAYDILHLILTQYFK